MDEDERPRQVLPWVTTGLEGIAAWSQRCPLAESFAQLGWLPIELAQEDGLLDAIVGVACRLVSHAANVPLDEPSMLNSSKLRSLMLIDRRKWLYVLYGIYHDKLRRLHRLVRLRAGREITSLSRFHGF